MGLAKDAALLFRKTDDLLDLLALLRFLRREIKTFFPDARAFEGQGWINTQRTGQFGYVTF